jgi:putative transposase
MERDNAPGYRAGTRQSIHLPAVDYSRSEMSFITICSSQRQALFGHIHENWTVLSRIGEIVRTCWTEIPQHFTNVVIESYVVMPNHLHGILTINSKLPGSIELPDTNSADKTASANESFGKLAANSIPTVIRSFKAAASKRARESGLVTAGTIWQRGYCERVLRNTREYVEVTNYILLNPARWAHDEDNPARIAQNP